MLELAAMAWNRSVAVYRLCFALLTYAAVVTQSVGNGANFDPVNYFSYFTLTAT